MRAEKILGVDLKELKLIFHGGARDEKFGIFWRNYRLRLKIAKFRTENFRL